jgi:hypothetical protein
MTDPTPERLPPAAPSDLSAPTSGRVLFLRLYNEAVDAVRGALEAPAPLATDTGFPPDGSGDYSRVRQGDSAAAAFKSAVDGLFASDQPVEWAEVDVVG